GDNAHAYANGGQGIEIEAGTATITGANATGNRAGSAFAFATNGTSYAWANGGNGIYAHSGVTKLTINSGTYTGAQGGTAQGDASSNADGGSGVRIENSELAINGGTFSGAAAGTAYGKNALARDGRGVFAVDSAVTINEVGTGVKTIVNGIYFTNSTLKALTLTKGTVNGDIDFAVKNGQTATFNISTNATITGTVRQQGGIVDVKLTQANASTQFKDVEIDGTMKFDKAFVSANDARFNLANNSQLVFANTLTLSTNASIGVGYGSVGTTGNLTMGNNSSMAFSYNGLSPANSGKATITSGALLMSDPTARIYVNGTAATSSGSFKPITATGTTLATNVNTMVKADLGWLVTPTAVENAGIRIDWAYSSLTNSSLSDLNPALLALLDATIASTNYTEFYNLNGLGQDAGEHLIRYSESQLPDMVDAAFQVQQQVAEQIAARGTEYRSMNGYASTKPRFGKKTAPAGAAGPAVSDDQTLQGWVRAYGSFAQRDTQGNFDSYNNTTWGSVVGVDKSFGKLLVGLAGGYANTDLDAGSTYQGDVDTYHGSIYSTIGGESTFVDLALSYGRSTSKEDSVVSQAEFDSDIYSGYLGLGKTFNATDTLAITPEISGLVSYYNQEAFTRTGIVPKNIPEYDAWSYLGTLGGNIATVHQIDWMDRGLAFIPEIRAHWLHEFNADLDNASYTVPTLPGDSFPLYMRPREEDLFRIGFGLDVWSWRYQRSKFEFDYDGLFADGYAQHIVSGKVTVRF
ncbi:MAG: autotransporter domain-containing protein, partial [Kiritimatiellales bacterium]|nr:autotransporter domain-containing protein [Kiritimatiellales bacterium]